MRLSIHIVPVVFVVIVLSMCQSAYAEIVTLNVTGIVDSIGTSNNFWLDVSVNIGSSMFGQCTYDTDAPNIGPSLNGIYTPISISMSIGNYTFVAGPISSDSAFFIVSTVDPGYRVYSTTSQFEGTIYKDNLPKNFNDIAWRWTDIELMDLLAGSGYSHSIELPNAESFPDISVFYPRKDFSVAFVDELWPSDSTGSFGIEGQITNITAVPEPSTLFFLSLGTLLLRKRKH
jgi:hypothetical protein